MKRPSHPRRRMAPGAGSWHRRRRRLKKLLRQEGIIPPARSVVWGPPTSYTPPPESQPTNALDDALEELAKWVEAEDQTFPSAPLSAVDDPMYKLVNELDPQGDLLGEIPDHQPTEELPTTDEFLLPPEDKASPITEDEQNNIDEKPIRRVNSQRKEKPSERLLC